MAIFQKAYQGYTGPLSPTLSRMLVIFRYALADVFRSRLFVAFFFVSLLLPLLLMCALYVYHNLELLLQFDVDLNGLTAIDGNVFAIAMQIPQNTLLFLMILAIGPTMISPDLRNNAMPLYLSRPINKASYVFGKLLVLIFLGSLISWVPGLLLIFLQAFLDVFGMAVEFVYADFYLEPAFALGVQFALQTAYFFLQFASPGIDLVPVLTFAITLLFQGILGLVHVPQLSGDVLLLGR